MVRTEWLGEGEPHLLELEVFASSPMGMSGRGEQECVRDECSEDLGCHI